ILTDRVVEEDLLEVPLTDRVFKIFVVIVALSMIAILGQFMYLGLVKHSFYESKALANISDRKIEPAPRGIITDRFEKPLVRNSPSFNVFLMPDLLPEVVEDRSKALKIIEKILGIDEVVVSGLITEREKTSNNRILLTDDLTQEQLVALSSQDIPGLYIESSFRRIHEIPLALSHIIGYTGLVDDEDIRENPTLTIYDVVGRTGLEAYYDKYLRGTNGEEVTFRDARGERQHTQPVREPQAGLDINTFIDREFQEYFYSRLKNSLDQLGRKVGVGLAMDLDTGEILALTNIPSFEPYKITRSLQSPDKPLFNRAVAGLYTPGSTIKPLHALVALVEGVVNPEKQIYSAGFIDLPNPFNPSEPSRFLDWRAHGWVDVRSALAKSSNVYFYEVGGGFESQLGIGIYKLKDWWRKFSFDSITGIDLPGEVAGFLPDPEWKEKNGRGRWRVGDTYNISIGQGDLLITPIELLNYISAIANGGKLYKPRVVDEITDREGRVVFKNEKTVIGDIDSDGVRKYIREVQEGMRDAVSEPYGTANLLADLPIKVAAKTGTSQISNNTKTNAFFVGYAPFDNPKIAILILIENSVEGSLNTVPVAKDIFLWYYTNRLN
ncbi:penicillin-binding protein 2, partial [Candidatus Jorgensenbacteria bacterium]|nr:penicillin-binding protein 2 [Candidatus Jorgensenbacteria bacterium]